MYTVLIVDDEITERDLVRFLLERDFPGQLNIIEAFNGKEALEKLNRLHIDILLTDVQMPFLSGIELAQQARLQYPDLEILFFSGYDAFEYVHSALMLQAVNYVLKPVNPEQFRSSIHKMLERLNSNVISFEKSSSWYDSSFFNDKPLSSEHNEIPSVELLLQKLLLSVQMKRPDDFSSLIDEFLSEIKNSNRSPVSVRHTCTSLLYLLINEASSKTEKDFDAAAKAIYTYRYFTDIEHDIRHYADLLLAELQRDAASSTYPVYQVKQYIHDHYEEELSLNLLADYVYLNPNYLSNLFTRVTGCSLNKYIRQYRMKKAYKLLTSTNMKVSDVGKAVGYTNTSYFIKAFQGVYGRTPINCRTDTLRREPGEST